MPELDDRIRAGLDRLAAQASPGDPFESVVARKRHRRWVRRADRAFLAVVVLAAVGGGSFALVQAFGFNQTKRPLAAPVRNGDIAFIRYEPRGGTTLDAMSPDGSDVRVIARLPDNFLSPGDPAWSPDGSKILFVKELAPVNPKARCADCVRSHQQLFVWDASTGRVRRLASIGGTISYPVWSPEGTKIAFTRSPSYGWAQNSAIWVMNADGSGLRRLTTIGSQAQSYAPAWSPDGRRIAFVGIRPKGASLYTNLYVMSAAGTGVHQLTRRSFYHDDGLAWSPDGREILFVPDQGTQRTELIFGIRPDGSHLVQVSPPGFYSVDPSWSPDGKKIVFAHAGHVYVMDANGMHVKLVDRFAQAGVSSPAWQPIPNASPAIPGGS